MASGGPRGGLGTGWALAALLLLLPPCASANFQHLGSSVAQKQPGSGGDPLVQELDVGSNSVLCFLLLLSGSVVVIMMALRLKLWCARRPKRVAKRRAVTAEEVDERFPASAGAKGEPTCVICLCNIEVEDACRTTQCGHTFHADCILQWWLHKPRTVLRCPTCRQRQRKDMERKARRGPPPGSPGEHSPGCETLGKPEDHCSIDGEYDVTSVTV